jgi:hypothetical protein
VRLSIDVPWVKNEERSEIRKMLVVWVIVDGGKVSTFTVLCGLESNELVIATAFPARSTVTHLLTLSMS